MTTPRMPSIDVPDHVEHTGAYIAGAKARIKANRAKGARAKWLAQSQTAQTCIDFLTGGGEFECNKRIVQHDEDGQPYYGYADHPVIRASHGEFYTKMVDTLSDWGCLTAGQESAVLRMIDRAKERLAQREAAKAEKAATALHIGSVGERRDFTLTLKATASYDTQFGTTFVHIMEDGEGNVVVYKGSKRLNGEKGEILSFKATIKEHGERDGIKQTIIARPVQK